MYTARPPSSAIESGRNSTSPRVTADPRTSNASSVSQREARATLNTGSSPATMEPPLPFRGRGAILPTLAPSLFVVQVGSEPASGFVERPALAAGGGPPRVAAAPADARGADLD